MTKKKETGEYRVRETDEFAVDDTDLDEAPITLPSGRVLDEQAAAEYGREVADRAARRRGRPSLTAPGQHSPKVSARVRPDVKADLEQYARQHGRRPADVLREALEEYLEAHRASSTG